MKSRDKMGMKCLSLVLTGMVMMTSPIWAKDYEGHWAEGAIDKWSSYGVVKGMENGDFAPASPVTRAELATFISRTFDFGDTQSTRTYTDIEEGKWYTQAIQAVSSKGLMYIPGTNFEPSKPATREEVAYTIAKAYKMEATGEEITSFTDEESISIWAKEGIHALAQRGIIKGNPDGSFRPKAPVTRAEVVTMLENIAPHRIQAAGKYTEPAYEGNVMITASDVTLKDTVINGNVYITANVDQGSIRLENVTINGNLYIEGGKVTLSGTYNEVYLGSIHNFDFTKGTMKKLVVTVPNVGVRLREKTVTDYLLVAAEAKFNIEGIVKETSNGAAEKVELEEACIFVGGSKIPLEVDGTEIVMNLNKLAARTPGYDGMESIMISTNVEGAYIEGPFGGRLETNTPYSFRTADRQLGMFEEVLEQMTKDSPQLKKLASSLDLSSDTLFAMLMENGTISISNMRDQFYTMNVLARKYTGSTLPKEYTFKRTLRYENELPIKITIRLEVE